jgi:hypothetical protein
MGHPGGARVSRYILDGTDPDLRRLLSIAERSAELASRALSRAGVSAGWAAIDCGCGPVDALAAERFDGIVQGLRAQAAKGEDLWSSSGFGLELELRKPVSA